MRRFFELKSWYSILWRLTAPREGKGIFGESQLASSEYSLEVSDGWIWQILGWYQIFQKPQLEFIDLKNYNCSLFEGLFIQNGAVTNQSTMPIPMYHFI
jgi:hypothetical protein